MTKTQNAFSSVNTQTVFTEQFNKVDANLAIAISPLVSGDDQVTLKIRVEISDFIGTPPANAPRRLRPASLSPSSGHTMKT